MSSSFRFILPQPPITAASTNPGDGDSNDMLPTFAKNSAPCANCSSAQQACIIHAPYSRFLCKKCSREHRNECPPHMPRIDAMLWKQLDRMSKLTGATSIQDVNLNVPTAVFIEGSANNEGTIAYSLPNLCAEATIQQGQNMEIHTSDAQGSQMPAFIENFGLHP
ncbi:hypothetical protein BD410DRAFT_187596 [Rickenella mellea]|uniref:Uncharacterized protein n=1 Tax=Rickenella mellea TaxID=50990 RepID=A0A4Y7Q5X2_9AGAM|nr:hypothetical protein BD410DRAFT_187596 [Rickenella mellea]